MDPERLDPELLREKQRQAELQRLHEALLNTLAPSMNQWVHKVYRNAKGAYETWKNSARA
jgi:hypothetical protein